MAAPTRTESATLIGNVIALLDNYLTVLTVPADEDVLTQSLETDFSREVSSGASLFRSAVSGALTTPADSALSASLLSFVHHQVGTPERDDQRVISRLYQDLVDAAETIQSRVFVFGTPTADGGNTGDGSVDRLTVDENSFDLEAQHADLKTLVCTRDQSNGSQKHREAFLIRGANAEIDAIAINGSGRTRSDGETVSKTSQDSPLQNAGFEQFSLGSGGPFAGGVATLAADSVITGWTHTTALTNFQLDQNANRQRRDLAGVTSPTSIRFLANDGLTQALSVNNVQLSASTPYVVKFHLFKENAADGTLTVTWGSQSQAISVAGLVNTAWNEVTVDIDQDLWLVNFNGTDPVFSMVWTGRTVGEIVIDEVETFIPFWFFDGAWYHISGGEVKWLIEDEWTWTDTIASDSQLQKWLWRRYGRHLPHSAMPSAIWAEPF